MKNYIICLSKISSSLETATELQKKLLSYGADAELFEGTYGNVAVDMMQTESRTVHPIGIKGQLDPGGQEAQKMSAPGVMGCFYSHYRLWQQCVKLNQPIAIWEDDIMLSRPFEPVDWNDVLILALGHPTKSPRWMHLLESPTGQPKALEYKSSSLPGACGYAIKPHAAKKLLEMYSKTFLPADNAINRNVVNIQIHSHIMGIAKVEGKKSLTKTSAWSKNKAIK